MSNDNHCKTCTCQVAVKIQKHKEHSFKTEPSYLIKTLDNVEKVWICTRRDNGYCLADKREVTNV